MTAPVAARTTTPEVELLPHGEFGDCPIEIDPTSDFPNCHIPKIGLRFGEQVCKRFKPCRLWEIMSHTMVDVRSKGRQAMGSW